MQRCDTVWGTSSLNPGLPSSSVYRDALYLPFNSGIFFDRDPNWGLYDSKGILIDFASYRRTNKDVLVGQSNFIDPLKYEWQDAPELDYIYAGPVIPHYGHFLLSSTARLWRLQPSSCALFHSDPSLLEHQAPYIKVLAELLEVKNIRIATLTQPTRLRSVVVPQPSFTEQKETFEIHGESCRQLGSTVVKSCVRKRMSSPVYLSKSQLLSGVQSIVNESEIEEILDNRGVKIIYPEKISLCEQISLFSGDECIVGTVSSAFHSQLLAENGGRRLVISSENFINANFLLVDKICRTHTTYVSASSIIEIINASTHFLRQYRITSTHAFADSICRWIDNPHLFNNVRSSWRRDDDRGVSLDKRFWAEHPQYRAPKSSMEFGRVDECLLPSNLHSRYVVGKHIDVKELGLSGETKRLNVIARSFDSDFVDRNLRSLRSSAVDIAFIEVVDVEKTIMMLRLLGKFMVSGSYILLTKKDSLLLDSDFEILDRSIKLEFPKIYSHSVNHVGIHRLLLGMIS